jgi:hypothetical protein
MRTRSLNAPHPEIARLRSGGWSIRAIARALHASPRQVFRWAAGDNDPLPVFASALASLPTAPPSPEGDAAPAP